MFIDTTNKLHLKLHPANSREYGNSSRSSYGAYCRCPSSRAVQKNCRRDARSHVWIGDDQNTGGGMDGFVFEHCVRMVDEANQRMSRVNGKRLFRYEDDEGCSGSSADMGSAVDERCPSLVNNATLTDTASGSPMGSPSIKRYDGRNKTLSLDGTGYGSAMRQYSIVGSFSYMAPEVMMMNLECGDGYDERVDYWSVGATLYRLLIGVDPLSTIHIRTLNDFRERAHDCFMRVEEQVYFSWQEYSDHCVNTDGAPIHTLRGKQQILRQLFAGINYEWQDSDGKVILDSTTRDFLCQLMQANPENRMDCGATSMCTCCTRPYQYARDHDFFANINWKMVDAKELCPPNAMNMEERPSTHPSKIGDLPCVSGRTLVNSRHGIGGDGLSIAGVTIGHNRLLRLNPFLRMLARSKHEWFETEYAHILLFRQASEASRRTKLSSSTDCFPKRHPSRHAKIDPEPNSNMVGHMMTTKQQSVFAHWHYVSDAFRRLYS